MTKPRTSLDSSPFVTHTPNTSDELHGAPRQSLAEVSQKQGLGQRVLTTIERSRLAGEGARQLEKQIRDTQVAIGGHALAIYESATRKTMAAQAAARDVQLSSELVAQEAAGQSQLNALGFEATLYQSEQFQNQMRVLNEKLASGALSREAYAELAARTHASAQRAANGIDLAVYAAQDDTAAYFANARRTHHPDQ